MRLFESLIEQWQILGPGGLSPSLILCKRKKESQKEEKLAGQVTKNPSSWSGSATVEIGFSVDKPLEANCMKLMLVNQSDTFF